MVNDDYIHNTLNKPYINHTLTIHGISIILVSSFLYQKTTLAKADTAISHISSQGLLSFGSGMETSMRVTSLTNFKVLRKINIIGFVTRCFHFEIGIEMLQQFSIVNSIGFLCHPMGPLELPCFLIISAPLHEISTGQFWRLDTLLCHDTWLHGKWTINISDFPMKKPIIYRGFSSQPCLMKPEGNYCLWIWMEYYWNMIGIYITL